MRTMARVFFLALASIAMTTPACAQTRPHEAGQSIIDIGERNARRAAPAWRDGIVINQSDTDVSRRTVWSDGRSATQFGSTVIYNDGTVATRSGERTIFGNGRMCGQVGALTLCD